MDAIKVNRIASRIVEKASNEAVTVIRELQMAEKEVHHARFSILTELYGMDDYKEMLAKAKSILEELKFVIGLCYTELRMPHNVEAGSMG